MKRTLNVDVLTPIPGFDFGRHWALAEDAVMAFTSDAGTIKRDIEALEEAARKQQP